MSFVSRIAALVLLILTFNVPPIRIKAAQTRFREERFTAMAVNMALAAGAQTTTPTETTPAVASPSPSSDASTRPATTTFCGDTGLWFVPSAEVLRHGQWSATGNRRGTNCI